MRAGRHPHGGGWVRCPPRDSTPWILVQSLEIQTTIPLWSSMGQTQGRTQDLEWRAQAGWPRATTRWRSSAYQASPRPIWVLRQLHNFQKFYYNLSQMYEPPQMEQTPVKSLEGARRSNLVGYLLIHVYKKYCRGLIMTLGRYSLSL